MPQRGRHPSPVLYSSANMAVVRGRRTSVIRQSWPRRALVALEGAQADQGGLPGKNAKENAGECGMRGN